MELYIFNQNRVLMGIVESFEYLRWTRKYSYCGSFELKAIATESNIDLLQLGCWLWKNDDEEIAVIEHLEMTMTEQEYILVSGRFATSLLARRIIWGTETLTGDLSAGISQLINRHLITPTDDARKITGVAFSSPFLYVPVNTQVSYKNLLDTVTTLCDASDVGIKTVFDPNTKAFTVKLYQGTLTQAVFSKEYENLTEQIYMNSALDYANSALIGGEGEGSERTFVSISGGSGEDRYELFVDAKDLRSEDFPTSYQEALLFRGESKLNELSLVQSFEAAINPHGNLTYKVDFDVGSLVRVVSKKWGLLLTTRITEIEESYDRDGQSINVTFGKGVLTLLQKLKGGM